RRGDPRRSVSGVDEPLKVLLDVLGGYPIFSRGLPKSGDRSLEDYGWLRHMVTVSSVDSLRQSKRPHLLPKAQACHLFRGGRFETGAPGLLRGAVVYVCTKLLGARE